MGRMKCRVLTTQPVASLEEVQRHVESGSTRRQTGSHDLNDRSSRSHLILSLDVECRRKDEVLSSRLNLVDLAWSERYQGRAPRGSVEGGPVDHQVAVVLGDVVNALAKKTQCHVPYRNSKLTYLARFFIKSRPRAHGREHLAAGSGRVRRRSARSRSRRGAATWSWGRRSRGPRPRGSCGRSRRSGRSRRGSMRLALAAIVPLWPWPACRRRRRGRCGRRLRSTVVLLKTFGSLGPRGASLAVRSSRARPRSRPITPCGGRSSSSSAPSIEDGCTPVAS